MAYDSKKLRTLKWLDALAKKKRRYQEYAHAERLHDVFARYGRMYATDSYICAYVEYPEESEAGEYEWCVLDRFADDNGKLLEFVEYIPMSDKWQVFNTDDYFFKLFPKPTEYVNANVAPYFDPALMKFMIEPFGINDLDMSIGFTQTGMVISGHNHDVSILVFGMGKLFKEDRKKLGRR